MGYMRHHAIICTSWDEEHITTAHKKAKKLFDNEIVSDISMPVTNGYCSFAVFPDGSKEGWPESNQGDAARDAFTGWLAKKGLYVAWVEVQFGDDMQETKVIRDSDHIEG